MPTVVYGGDLDAHGFLMLDRLRGTGIRAETILMDEPTRAGTHTARARSRSAVATPIGLARRYWHWVGRSINQGRPQHHHLETVAQQVSGH